ncbi:S41 family peptidase [Aquisalinus flavus]|uniref:Peptidase S41 n=1 Tax=Aquisalinus flavus TaxID=1526572 RepID=A0A8J2V6R5_9PROT|nr:S41 family peptidase [Aquisalinus flavus]MBD0425272.1 S41 family peptidase [Aquisalinus flavus]UNE49074.1 S41 family peptidase [Aquisalinus flavus]GGD17349.1 peptidase S41 [Aquisalinus flavus]
MKATDRRTRRINEQREPKKGTSLSALAAAALAGSAVTTVLLTSGFARSTISADTFRQLDLFGEVFEQVHENYVSDPDNKIMIEGAINGMLQNLDPHSSYLSADDYESMQEQTRGSFAGLGIQVTMDNDGRGKGLVRVVSPIDDTPAARAGIQTNDLIYEIDGEAVFGMTLNEAIELMKGPRGTPVDLKLLREERDEPVEVTIVRDIVEVSPVSHRIEREQFGYLRLTNFTAKTEEKMLQAIAEMDEEIPGGMKGLIIDVRSNPGGLLDQAVAVSDAFLEGGEIVSTRGRRAKDTMRELGTPGDVLAGRPIIVLINNGSASASEIVAGALQDRNRALVLGTKSFGKGSVQTLLPLQNGMNGALRLTTARYYTPAGRSIQALGIVPDIAMPIIRPDEEDSPGRRFESDLDGALAAEIRAGHEEDTDEDLSVLVEPIECAEGEDCQLNKALDLLDNNSRFSELLADASQIER